MKSEIDDFIDSYNVMTVFDHGVPIKFRTLARETNMHYVEVIIDGFRFEALCYEEKVIVCISLLKYIMHHKQLIDYLTHSSNSEVSHLSTDTSIHNARYTFYEFENFRKLLVKMIEISAKRA